MMIGYYSRPVSLTSGRRPAKKPKRMKSDPPSRVLTPAEKYTEELHSVFSFRKAIPVVSDDVIDGANE
jgi:hypothetical protein